MLEKKAAAFERRLKMEAPLHSVTMDPSRLLLSPREQTDDVVEAELLVIAESLPTSLRGARGLDSRTPAGAGKDD